MGFSSGVAAQAGYKTESSWGTEVVVDHFADFNDAEADVDQRWAEGEGMYAGGQYRRLGRTIQVARKGQGTYEVDVTTSKMGPLFRQMLGSSLATPVLISGSAYKQVHLSGSQDGLSTTFQFGIPEVSTGTVKPQTLVGTKVADWELSSEVEGFLKLALGLDAKDMRTLTTTPAANALAAASYVATTEPFHHHQLVVKIGGTASTASSVVSIASGVTVASVINSVSLKSTNNLAAEGFGTSSTMAREQKSKRSETTLTLDAEFNTQAEFYDVFRAGTIVPVQLTWTGSLIGGSNYNTVDVVIAGAKIKNAPNRLNDDDLASHSIELEVGYDGTNNPLQITLINGESSM